MVAALVLGALAVALVRATARPTAMDALDPPPDAGAVLRARRATTTSSDAAEPPPPPPPHEKLGARVRWPSPSCAVPAHRVNDDYCDCADGSDEPATGACAPLGASFSCAMRGAGFPGQVAPSRVRDGVVDCCDGSDELLGESDARLAQTQCRGRAAAAAATTAATTTTTTTTTTRTTTRRTRALHG